MDARRESSTLSSDFFGGANAGAFSAGTAARPGAGDGEAGNVVENPQHRIPQLGIEAMDIQDAIPQLGIEAMDVQDAIPRLGIEAMDVQDAIP